LQIHLGPLPLPPSLARSEVRNIFFKFYTTCAEVYDDDEDVAFWGATPPRDVLGQNRPRLNGLVSLGRLWVRLDDLGQHGPVCDRLDSQDTLVLGQG